ncbi:DUF4147 domain-containing protein [Streptomyces montanus]|uniref:DUF4147 domain-containing protein n=1 Tax=Streptomyces montanus TaxID=2580423 RepID=UPI0014863160|nr:DUF4147 domain-containing protein [Streptomyces montanus]
MDIVSIGKMARELMRAARALLGAKIRHSLTITAPQNGVAACDELIGDHPIPTARSMLAGKALVEFVAAGRGSSTPVIFLVSGGTSSVCVAPTPPVTLPDLQAIWHAALAAGIDVTRLNQLRAAVSRIHGGGILRLCRDRASWSFIVVDNVQSGIEWVGSGLTFPYEPDRQLVGELLRVLALDADVGARIWDAVGARAQMNEAELVRRHENWVIADTSLSLQVATETAINKGYHVVSMGGKVQGDVRLLARRFGEYLAQPELRGRRVCILGAGEGTVQVRGQGRGGRCQELALRMGRELVSARGYAYFAAAASDGQDHLPGVGGAWVDSFSWDRINALSSVDVERAMADNDSYNVLRRVGGLLPGVPTGWNLCDIYVLCAEE